MAGGGFVMIIMVNERSQDLADVRGVVRWMLGLGRC